MIGRVEVEADHIANLFHKEWIGGELETLAAVRLQGEELKDPMHGGFRQAVGFCCQANTPVGSCRRLLLEGAAQQKGNLFIRN